MDRKLYIYSPKRKIRIREKWNIQNYRIKIKLLSILASKKQFRKRLNQYDVFTTSVNSDINKKKIRESLNLGGTVKSIYTDISLNEIVYHETIEIDLFQKYEKKLLSGYNSEQFLFSTNSQKSLKENLSKVKGNFDVISWGNLFTLNLSKSESVKNDLIHSAQFGYTKTTESFFIVDIKITPSEKFNKKFNKIIEQDDFGFSEYKLNSWLEIIKSRSFISHELMHSSIKTENIKNLIKDLDFQVKQNLSKYFLKNFQNNKYLSRTELYIVDDIKKFHSDLDLNGQFQMKTQSTYSIADRAIEVYMPDNSDKYETVIQIVKTKGHGAKVTETNVIADYDAQETRYLLEGLGFTCNIVNVLRNQHSRLNQLKREVYDYSKLSNNTNFIKKRIFFFYNGRFVRLKQELNTLLLSTKRFEKEFSIYNMQRYTRHFDFNSFFKINSSTNGLTDKRLLDSSFAEMQSSFKSLENKTKEINDIFKSIEELNSYRSNIHLQLISLFVGAIALIFTFDKVKDFFSWLFNI
jgi:hypothetical protein